MSGDSASVKRAGKFDIIPSTPNASTLDFVGGGIVRSQVRDKLTWLLRGIIAFLVIVECLAVFVPFEPGFPTAQLDSGWQFGLNAAVEKGMVFGRDIIFTFGPYASTYTRQYHPATDIRMLWSAGLLAVAFAVGLTILARDHYKLSVLLTLPLLGITTFLPDPLFFCNPLAFILLVCRIATPETHSANISATAPVKFGLALMVLALSLQPLIKGTFGAAAFIAGGLAWALLMIRGQKILAMSGALLFVLGILAFWIDAGQPLIQLPNFFIAQEPIISGYSDAMSSFGPFRECVIYLAVCCMLALLNLRFVRSSGLAGIVLAIGVALILFVAFKGGFIRHDGHALIAAGVIGCTGWIFAIGLPGTRPILALAVCLAGWAVIDQHYTGLTIWTVKDRIVQPFYRMANGVAMRVEAGGALRKKFYESLNMIRGEQPLPALQGSSDIYSYGQTTLLANRLDWAPRPVFQSYSAYTPALLEKNAAHLAGDSAPQNILFTVQPIDGRLPSLDDGLSWPSLLTSYEPAALIGDMAVLHRRLEPTVSQILRDPPIASGAYEIGDDISFPATSRALWAKVDVKPTLLGKIVSAIYKLPQLEIEFHMPDGGAQKFRYIAGMGETGFIVSPIVRNTSDFLALELSRRTEYFNEDRPQSMSISVLGGRAASWLWNRRLSVQMFSLVIPTQRQASSLLLTRTILSEARGRKPQHCRRPVIARSIKSTIVQAIIRLPRSRPFCALKDGLRCR